MRFGFEAEYGLVDEADALVDFTHARAGELQQIVDSLPDHADQDLTRGDLAIKWSRWYVEGDERFADDGTFLRCVPKGIEVRTPIADGIGSAVAALAAQTAELEVAAGERSLRLTALGHNPVHSVYAPAPAFNPWELRMRAEHSEYDAPEVYMCTYGPDVNLSDPSWSATDSLAVATRLALWAPEIVAFSLNAPFVDGHPYGGLSYRTAVRAGRRPNVRLFLDPSLGDRAESHTLPAGLVVRPARIPAEHGRIEFKALDAFADLPRFAAFASLLGGLAGAEGAPAPSDLEFGLEPDPGARLRSAAAAGFEDDALVTRCGSLLDLAEKAWSGASEADLADPLRADLECRRVPAHQLLESFAQAGRVLLPALTLPQ